MMRLAPFIFVTLAFAGRLAADPMLSPEEVAFRNTLAIKKAMVLAEHYLRVDETQKAVELLEDQVPKVVSDPAFMNLLQTAYRSHVKGLTLRGQAAQAQRYEQRLAILDPEQRGSVKPREPLKIEVKTGIDDALPNFAERGPDLKGEIKGVAQKAVVTPGLIAADSVRGPDLLGKVQPSAKVVRFQKEDPQDNPFDDANQRSPVFRTSVEKNMAAHYLAKADEEYGKERYAQAKQFYDQAYQADRETLEAYRERYAYCLLFDAMTALNGLPTREKASADNRQAEFQQSLSKLQKQIQSAMSLSPKLQGQGQTALKEIDNRQLGSLTLAVPVQHLGKNPQGWHVSESSHFRIFHNQPAEYVEKAAQIAERTRVAMSRRWFGTDTEVWNPKCELVLHATASDYSALTKVPASSPGHSRIESDPATHRVIGRRMDLRVDNPHLLEAVLPHETTHVVLAGRFGPHAVPRWADEGIAVLSEPAYKLEQHRKNLLKAIEEKQGIFGLAELMRLTDYPEPRKLEIFYAQSVTLMAHLETMKGPHVLVEFVRDGLKDGYDVALQRHYQLNFQSLSTAWWQDLTARQVASAARN